MTEVRARNRRRRGAGPAPGAVASPIPYAAVAVLVAAGLAVRIWLLRSPMGLFDSDEAMSPLIARHMLRGEFSVFLWGTPYGGTLEALIGAPILALWADPVVLKLVVVALYGWGCALTWAIARRLLRDEATARFAAVLMWVASPAFIFASTKARLYYGSGLCLALGIVLCSIHLAEARSRRWMVVLGLLLGLGLWTTPMVGYVAVPTLAWLLVKHRDRWRDLHLAAMGAVLGAAPWLAFNLRNRGASFRQNSDLGTDYWDRLEGFFLGLLPRSLGLRALASDDWSGNDAIAITLYSVLLIVFLVVVIHALWRRSSPYELLLVIACSYPLLFALPNASFYVNEPRYGLFLWPVVALLLASGATRLFRSSTIQAGVLGLVTLSSMLALSALLQWGRANPGNWDLFPPDTSPIAAELKESGESTVWAEYWISYSLVLATRERVIADSPEFSRFKPYAERVRSSATTTYVYFSDSSEEQHFLNRARSAAIPARASALGPFVVYRAERPVPLD